MATNPVTILVTILVTNTIQVFETNLMPVAITNLVGEVGETADAKRYADVVADSKKPLLGAFREIVRRENSPPLVPVVLFGDEPVQDPILQSRIGSYWNIIIGFKIASGILPPDSEEESRIALPATARWFVLGPVALDGCQFNFWTNDNRINPLYATRYSLDTLRRDVPERSLVGFSGMLAQGFTGNNLICGEGCNLHPLDHGGRRFCCPPTALRMRTSSPGSVPSLCRTGTGTATASGRRCGSVSPSQNPDSKMGKPSRSSGCQPRSGRLLLASNEGRLRAKWLSKSRC